MKNIKPILKTQGWKEIRSLFLKRIEKLNDVDTIDCGIGVEEIGKKVIARSEAVKLLKNFLHELENIEAQKDKKDKTLYR